MTISRRTLLGTSAGLLAARTPVFAIGATDLTPYDFGAKGDGSDDTAAFNRAVREAARLRRPLMIPRGDFRLLPTETKSWDLPNLARRDPVHVCVELVSGLSVVGRGGRILTSAPASLDGNERIFLFGTGFNIRQGVLQDILFDEVEIDFAEQFGRILPYTYAFGLTGTDNFQQRNLLIHSSGRRAGRGMLFENGRDRRQTGCRHRNMVQGHFIRYEHGPVIRDVSFERLTECMDWDGPCWGVDAQNLHFKDLVGEGQCIDTAGGSDWNVRNVTAENTGSIFFIYSKSKSWPTYAEWVNGHGMDTPTCVIAERMRFSNIRGQRAGRRGEETFRVSNYRNGRLPPALEGMSPSRDITIEDVSIDGGYAASVNECRNLQLHRVSLRNMSVPDSAETGAALYLRQSTATPRTAHSSELSGAVSNLAVEQSQGIGLLVSAPSNLSLTNIRVEGYNFGNGANTRAGIEIRDLGRKPGVLQLENLTVGGGVGANLTDIGIDDPARRLAPGRVVMTGTLQGTTPGAAVASRP